MQTLYSIQRTKYIGGHNDVLAGVVTVKDGSLAEQLGQLHNMIGATLSPIDSYLLQRGLKHYIYVLNGQRQTLKS